MVTFLYFLVILVEIRVGNSRPLLFLNTLWNQKQKVCYCSTFSYT